MFSGSHAADIRVYGQSGQEHHQQRGLGHDEQRPDRRDLEAGLKTALVGAVTSTGAAFGAQFIGDMTVPGGPGQPAQLNPAGQALVHALLGCAAGAAGQGDSEGCGAGARGAVIGELAARWYNPTGSAGAQDTVAFASLMAGAGVALTGSGDADSVNTAAVTAAGI